MGMLEDFNQFWREFPRKVGKLDAEKAYKKARKLATAEDILNGIAVYLQTKPAYADYCHPATWLNKGRWLDEAPAADAAWICTHDTHCGSAWRCHQRTQLELARQQRES